MSRIGDSINSPAAKSYDNLESNSEVTQTSDMETKSVP